MELIEFVTKRAFKDQIENNKKKNILVGNKYNNCVFIIDEAHNFFGNTGSDNILYLNNFFIENNKDDSKPLYILVTGSPITNTMVTLKDLVSIISYKIINETEFMAQEGKKIFNIVLTEQGKKIIKELLYDKISYFNQEKREIPPVIFKGKPLINLPIIPCIMSQEQTDSYYDIQKFIKNEMFLKYLLDASFTAMGYIGNIYDFESYIKDKKYLKLTNTLSLNKGKFVGEELKTLNNSCKLKYFVNEKLNKPITYKTFVYFANSRIGGRFLKDVLKTMGVQEYGAKKLDNFICYYCERKRSCKKCKPITYIMITSIYLTKLKSNIKEENINIENNENHSSNTINSLLDIYNSPNNDNGEEVAFLFGSKIISESYTLTETLDIWFLTNPESLSEMIQIMARCLRNFSYKDLTKPVTVYVLVAITNDFDIDKILKKNKNSNNSSIYLTNPYGFQNDINNYIEELMKEDVKYPYDLKKVLYLEIKSKQTNEIHNLFKKLSIKKKEKIHPMLEKLYVIEMLRRISFSKSKFTLVEFLSYIPKELISEEIVEMHVEEFIKDGVIFFNKFFNQCFLIKYENFYITKPILLEYKPFIYKIDL